MSVITVWYDAIDIAAQPGTWYTFVNIATLILDEKRMPSQLDLKIIHVAEGATLFVMLLTALALVMYS